MLRLRTRFGRRLAARTSSIDVNSAAGKSDKNSRCASSVIAILTIASNATWPVRSKRAMVETEIPVASARSALRIRRSIRKRAARSPTSRQISGAESN